MSRAKKQTPTLDPAMRRKPRRITIFLEHVAKQVAALKAAETEAERRACAHTLVGSCGVVGANRMSDLCAALDMAGVAPAEVPEGVERIEAELERVLAALRGELEA